MDHSFNNSTISFNRQKKIFSNVIYGNKVCGSCCGEKELKSIYSIYVINNEEFLLKDLIHHLYQVHVSIYEYDFSMIPE